VSYSYLARFWSYSRLLDPVTATVKTCLDVQIRKCSAIFGSCEVNNWYEIKNENIGAILEEINPVVENYSKMLSDHNLFQDVQDFVKTVVAK